MTAQYNPLFSANNIKDKFAERIKKMKSCISFIRGMGAGILAGMGIAVAIKCLCTNNKAMCKKTSKAARAIPAIISDIKEMLC